jgi:UDP-2,3-diacylglucosamine pyrophosphatase LpxH
MVNHKIYFISDLHIGSNEPTDWYQSDIHDPYLTAILNYVIANKDTVQELVLLGDLVDQWMYTPDTQPPNFKTITRNNPGIFGAQGALMRTLDALEGRVTYINGNHDMLITSLDIAALKSPGGYIMKYAGGIFYEPENCNRKLICTHGHVYSLFNAPDFHAYPPGYPGLPFGFFVSRLAARWSSQQFTSTMPNTAYFKDNGNPNGPVFTSKALEGALKQIAGGKGDIAAIFLGALLNATGNVDARFLMPDGQWMNVSDVESVYKDLFASYPACTNVPSHYFLENDNVTRLSALDNSDIANDLYVFARALGDPNKNNYKLVVMGHTHIFRDTSLEYFFPSSKSLYCNTGFDCPSIPDMQDTRKNIAPTFVEVGIDSVNNQFVVTIYKVVKSGSQYQIQTAAGPSNVSMK